MKSRDLVADLDYIGNIILSVIGWTIAFFVFWFFVLLVIKIYKETSEASYTSKSDVYNKVPFSKTANRTTQDEAKQHSIFIAIMCTVGFVVFVLYAFLSQPYWNRFSTFVYVHLVLLAIFAVFYIIYRLFRRKLTVNLEANVATNIAGSVAYDIKSMTGQPAILSRVQAITNQVTTTYRQQVEDWLLKATFAHIEKEAKVRSHVLLEEARQYSTLNRKKEEHLRLAEKLEKSLDGVADQKRMLGYWFTKASTVVQSTVPYFPKSDNHSAVTFTTNLFDLVPDKLDYISKVTSYAPNVSPPDRRMSEEEVYEKYVKGTFIEPLLNMPVEYGLPEDARFEHTWLLASSGAGKTELLSYLVSRDFDAVRSNKASIVVMDSQGELIRQIRDLKIFAKDQPLEGKLVVIEPDPEYPLALNIFDLGRDRIKDYSAREQERLTNHTIELMTYVFDAMMGEAGKMTPKQTTLYRYIIRLLVSVPNATIKTFAQLLEPNGLEPYEEYVDQLSSSGQAFFRNQFNDHKLYGNTKQEVGWRLANMLEHNTFDKMFSSPKTKLDLFTELNSSKVILINTDLDLLGAERTNLFGRFFIALLLSASQERASVAKGDRLPVYAYIDEASDYIASDHKIATILDQARKMKIAMLLAHQRTKQIKNPNVLDALKTTSIRIASTDNPDDASIVAKTMNTYPEFISQQPKYHFGLFVRQHTPAPLSLTIPHLAFENAARMSAEEKQELLQDMRARYAISPEDIGDEVYKAPRKQEPDDDDGGLEPSGL